MEQNTTKVYTVIDNSCIDYDCSCSGLVGVFTTLEAAKACLQERAETYDDLKERWDDGEGNEHWNITDEYFEIFEDGYYSENHAEISITESYLDKPLYNI